MTKACRGKSYLPILPITTIIFLSAITYLNCIPNQFVYDDVSTIVENRLIKDWKNFPTLFTHDYFKYSGELTYRPIVTLSYFIDYSLWHVNPMGYHIVNVLLHATNVTLIYFLILLISRRSAIYYPQKKNDRTSCGGIALLTCIFFAIHPLVSEVVNSVSFREDLITTAFLLTSFSFFLLYKETSIKKNTATFPAVALVTYFFALLSKESAIVLPALIFFFELLFHEREGAVSCTAGIPDEHRDIPPQFGSYNQTPKEVFTLYKAISKIILRPTFLGYIGVSIAYLVLRFFILHNPNEKIAYPEGSFLVNMLTVTKVLGRYITSIFLPLNLNADYHVLFIKTPLSLSFLIPLFMLISIAIIATRLRGKATGQQLRFPTNNRGKKAPLQKNYPLMLFSILWFFVSILPVMNIIPLANIMADRYLYLPIPGFCIFISTVLVNAKKALKYPIIISLLLLYVFITITRNNIWRDEFTLWYKSSQSPFCSFTTYNNLGTQYNKKGYPDTALHYYQKSIQKAREVGFVHYATVYYNAGNVFEKKGLIQQALSAYKKAIQIKPDYKEARNNLGKVYFTLGHYDDALTEYNNAIAIDPDFPYAYNNLGVLYNKLGRQDEAASAYKKALSQDPQYGDAYYNLGNIYEAKKQYDLALEAYKSAIKFNPEQVYVHNNLGTIYEKRGLTEEAIAEYKQSIKLDPKYPYSYNNLGVCLIKKGTMNEALAEFQKAVELFPNQPDFHFNMGYTYLQKGDLDNALKEFETTHEIAPSHAEALFCMGTVYHKQGHNEKANKMWQEVLGLNPDHEKAKKCLEMLSK